LSLILRLSRRSFIFNPITMFANNNHLQAICKQNLRLYMTKQKQNLLKTLKTYNIA